MCEVAAVAAGLIKVGVLKATPTLALSASRERSGKGPTGMADNGPEVSVEAFSAPFVSSFPAAYDLSFHAS